MPDIESPARRTIRGPLVLLALAVMLLGVPAVILTMLYWMPAEIRHERLNWYARESWKVLPVRSANIQESGLAAVLGGAGYRKIPFQISAEHEAALIRAMAIADQLEVVQGDPPVQLRDELAALAEQHPDLFYPAYLLATWHSKAGDAAAAEQWTAEAFARAPAALVVPYVDEHEQPIANLQVGTIELGFDRVAERQVEGVTRRELDQTLELSYPALVTDEHGRVYLPVYHTIYRTVRLPSPEGRTATYNVHRWFESPSQVGGLRSVVVE